MTKIKDFLIGITAWMLGSLLFMGFLSTMISAINRHKDDMELSVIVLFLMIFGGSFMITKYIIGYGTKKLTNVFGE